MHPFAEFGLLWVTLYVLGARAAVGAGLPVRDFVLDGSVLFGRVSLAEGGLNLLDGDGGVS